MNDTKAYPITNLKSFFYKFILILIIIQIADNILTFLLAKLSISTPNIVQYRLVSMVSQIVVFIGLMAFLKPSAKDLGIEWADMKRSSKILYLIGDLIVVAMVISSYFIMPDRKYFVLITNLYFGITTPIFEEIIFRGYGWGKFRSENHGNLVTLIITTLLFGLFHLGYYFQIAYATALHPDAPSMVKIMTMKVIYGTAFGLVMGLIRWKSNKTFAPILIHGILNIIGE